MDGPRTSTLVSVSGGTNSQWFLYGFCFGTPSLLPESIRRQTTDLLSR